MNKLSNKDIGELLRASFADDAPDKADDIIRRIPPRPTASCRKATVKNT